MQEGGRLTLFLDLMQDACGEESTFQEALGSSIRTAHYHCRVVRFIAWWSVRIDDYCMTILTLHPTNPIMRAISLLAVGSISYAPTGYEAQVVAFLRDGDDTNADLQDSSKAMKPCHIEALISQARAVSFDDTTWKLLHGRGHTLDGIALVPAIRGLQLWRWSRAQCVSKPA